MKDIKIMNGAEAKNIISLQDQNKISDNDIYSMCFDYSYNNIGNVRVFKIGHGIEIECNKKIKDELENRLPSHLKMDIKHIGYDRYLILFLEKDKEFIHPIASAVAYDDGNLRWKYTEEHFDLLEDNKND